MQKAFRRKLRAEIGGEGIKSGEHPPASPAKRRSEAERHGGDPVRVHSREEGGIPVLRDGANRLSEVRPGQEQREEEERGGARAEDEEDGAPTRTPRIATDFRV